MHTWQWYQPLVLLDYSVTVAAILAVASAFAHSFSAEQFGQYTCLNQVCQQWTEPSLFE